MQQILDAIGTWSSIISLPALALTYWQVYKVRQEAAVVRGRSATEGRVMFINIEDRVGVNDVPFADMKFLPRVGETVMLPGTTEGSAEYVVVGVRYSCFAEMLAGQPFKFEDEARTANIRVDVEPLRRKLSRTAGMNA